jgi:hypothetical protein
MLTKTKTKTISKKNHSLFFTKQKSKIKQQEQILSETTHFFEII